MLSSRTRLVVKTAAFTLLGAGVLGAAAGLVVLRAGWYDISATTQHWQPVYTLLEQGMHYSVRRYARDVAEPDLRQPQQILRGAALYRDNCAQCHGGPGFAQAQHGMSMQPVPGPLVDASSRWRARELYWITRHGIKMSGMPAWDLHLSEAETWAVVAFVAAMPTLDARQYRALTAFAADGAPARRGDARGQAQEQELKRSPQYMKPQPEPRPGLQQESQPAPQRQPPQERK
ncbi:cytochrome c [Massilia forsythiae]|uniref:Cytochrome c n=1 Tax=Massilia forsythiae TaxID=2728020 RepID=A0A7Z2VUT0_9BURK|nr:cytochrome c [Massilia forsythiae]QJD99568.1 cytochrome c [Massilia forsythiae]